ncbi:S41 family peptidase [Luteibacter sp. UNCMF366Tsu5.1]|uniref:S41 family peptidase n=1 Tax=Luteibacter sp. UNCMF366Tsu5.1 TaxID=1502758 RepID=UPI000908AE5C|nr:S41 family peptidase [Luteibacter sp. UNCMF366Tsu5.1]SFW24542.1 Peptidase family S41 [Luteibacter sp. UNCMF366Tsu5.1]
MKSLLATALLLTAPIASAQDWAASLRMDAKAMHDDIARNHPGPVDPENPGFAAKNDQALALALQRAGSTTTYAGYLYALIAYAATFDDGHLAVFVPEDVIQPPLVTRWPGFLTTFDTKDDQRVVTRAADAPVPLGARLIACDGKDAAALARDNVGGMGGSGQWNLHASRVMRGKRLFTDVGNPWIKRPVRCTFDVDGTRRTVDLAWRPIDDKELDRRFAEAFRRKAEPIGMRTLSDGTVWIALSDFDGDPDHPAAKALEPLIAKVQSQRETILAAPRVVLDLRGNNGGDSGWSHRVAEALWGKKAVDAVNLAPTRVDWRASQDNMAQMQSYVRMWSAHADAPPENLAWGKSTVAGMQAAMAKGEPFYMEPGEAKRPTPKPPKTHTRIFMVTDSGCASACLDAADLFLALGAVHVGQVTSADTAYMDIRRTMLPSGHIALVVPMKVYRGRQRGSNVPLVPRYVYQADLTDNTALERWIAGLR